jgi:hypothetical protein
MKARLDTTAKEQWVSTGDESDASANPQPRDTGETRLLDGSSMAQLLPLRHRAAGWQVAVGWSDPLRGVSGSFEGARDGRGMAGGRRPGAVTDRFEG